MDLSDITVLDLSWLLPGPFATMLLGDMGAEVIKIEEPERGDYARWLGPVEVGESGYGPMFHSVNRNKKSVAMDLKSEEGTEAFLELACEADVVFEQFRPGVVDRLGIGYEDVREVNEDIVYCSLSGYGQTGPYSDRVGHDPIYQAVGGILDGTRSRDGDVPAIPDYPVADMSGGLMAAFSVVSALLSRELGSGGEYLDVSLTESLVSLATGDGWRAFMSDQLPESERSIRRTHPCSGIYPTKDGRYISVSAPEEKFWKQLLAELDRPDLEEYQFASGEDKHYAMQELSNEFERRTLEEWESFLSDEAMAAPVNEFAEVFDHPQIEARNLVDEVELDDGTVFEQIGFPITTANDEDHAIRSPAPKFGEHTSDVLQRVLSPDDIDNLSERDIIGLSD